MRLCRASKTRTPPDLRRRHMNTSEVPCINEDVGFYRCRVDIQLEEPRDTEAQAVGEKSGAQAPCESECAHEVASGPTDRHDEDDRFGTILKISGRICL